MPNKALIKNGLPVLIGVSVLLSLSMGIRQSLGIFMPPLTQEIDVSVSGFTLAIAVQSLSWGILQPFIGAWAVRHGFKSLLMMGAFTYICGLIILGTAQGGFAVFIGAGLIIGFALACTGSAIAMAVASRSSPPAMRSMILGVVSAAGSIGTLIAAPIGQVLSQTYGWRFGILGFVILLCIMIPAAWFAGRVDQLPMPPSPINENNNAKEIALIALKYPPFLVMTIAYFVCGMQLVFITTHLPSYLEICGLDPMLSAKALGVIGGFNALGSLFFGWIGGKYNKLFILGMIYILRSIGIAIYFFSFPNPENTLIFAAFMGFLWLGVAPLVAGSISETFGVKWQAMLMGVSFMSHQLGSFIGAFGGGLLYDALGSYTLAWQIGVGVGLSAGITQLLFSLTKPTQTPTLATAQ